MNAAQYDEILRLLSDIAARLDRIENSTHAPTPAPAVAVCDSGAPTIADDRDLDSQFGNPEIKKDPPRWTGPSFVGGRFSDTTPEYLETLAGFLDWKANESDKKGEVLKNGAPRSKFIRLDAARARGWRKRLLQGNGKAARPAPRPRAPEAEAEEMPFLKNTAGAPRSIKARGPRTSSPRRTARRSRDRWG